MHPILRLASFATALAMLCFVPGCVQGNCAATCDTLLTVDFSSPIGLPGSYRFQIGKHECLVDLPTTRPTCGRWNNQSIVGFDFAEKAPTDPLEVVIAKDGVEILRTPATMRTNGSFDVCGETCHRSSFGVQVPESLAPPARTACDRAAITGVYTVKSGSVTGTCSQLFTGDTVALDNGLWVMGDPACQSQVTLWDPAHCSLRSLVSCTTAEGANTWILAATDLYGDGAILEGTIEVSRSYQSMCWVSAPIRLSR